ncbi:MAG: hypothetical protein VW378_08070 [bacterium]
MYRLLLGSGITGLFITIVVLYYEIWMSYNSFLSEIGFFVWYEVIFLLLSTFVIKYILNRKINKKFKISLFLIAYIALLFLSGASFGILPLLVWNVEEAIFTTLSCTIIGSSFGILYATPIYLGVVYFLYKDHQKIKS